MSRRVKEGLYKDQKSKYWYCRFYDKNGELRRYSTKEIDYQKATVFFNQKRHEVGCDFDANDSVLTVNKLITVYDQIRGQFLRGQLSYKKGVKQILLFYDNVDWMQLGVRGGAYSTHSYISKRLQKDGVKAGTVNREISILSAVANICIDEGYEIENYWRGKKLSVPRHQYHWLTVDQAKALLNASKKRGISLHLHDYLQIALGTGMRMSEILTLEARDIRLDLNEIWIRSTKNGNPHNIPMTESVRTAVKNRLNYCASCHSHYLFINPSTNQPIKTIIKPFKTACRRAGIIVSDKKNGVAGFRLHDLRHTTASWLIQNGATIEQVADLLNHSDIRTTQKYAHHALDARRGTVGKLPFF